MLKRISLIFIYLFIFLVCSAQEKPEENIVETKADTNIIKAIPLAQLSDAINSANKELKFLKAELSELPVLANFDSIFAIGKNKIDDEKQMLLLNEKQFGQREISDALKEWTNYSKKINSWLNLTNKNLLAIEENSEESEKMINTWTLTLQQLREDDINFALRTTALGIVKEYKDIQQEIKRRQDEILSKQEKLNSLLFDVNEVIYSLQNEEKLIKTEYFKRSAPPIWRIKEISNVSIPVKESFNNSVERHKRNFSIFYRAYESRFVLHFFILIMLLFGFYYQNKFFNLSPGEARPIFITSKLVISHYILSSLILALLLSIWLYPVRQNAVNDLLQLLILILSFTFLAQRKKSFKVFLLFAIVLFFVNQVQIFFQASELITRPTMLFESVISGFTLFLIIRPGSEIKKELLQKHWKFILYTVPILIFFSVVSFFANIIGNTNLASLLSETSSNSVFNAIIIVLATLVIRSIIIALLHSSFSQQSNLIRDKGPEIQKKVLSFFQFLAILIWTKSILLYLTIYDTIYNWITGLFKLSFSLGENEIVLGNFFKFLFLILITVYITRFVKLVLEEEVFPRIILPWVPGATSMIIGYILAAFGGYFALSAAGINLARFGLIVGALSVGIGFGLQGVVLNFISGLILAFERPIQVGDTVEIGTLTGEVKSIGVRASKIRTFDGMEVIVPNGNLISNNLINWTLTDRRRRYDINVGVAYGTDPHQVLALLKKVASEHPDVLKIPEPWALFVGFGESSLNFQIRIWTSIDTGLQTQSDIAVSINDALAEAGIEIPFPQRDLHIRSVDEDVEKAINENKVVKPKKPSAKKEGKAPE